METSRRKRTTDEIEEIILNINDLKNDSRVVFEELYQDLRDRVVGVSALGDFLKPLNAFLKLIKYPVAVMALVDHLNGLSDLNGREIETSSVLGAFLHVSGLPDHPAFASLPDLGLADDVKTRIGILRGSLEHVLNTMLEMNDGIRENVLQFIALFINKNAQRSHIQVDPLSCASSGTFVNLSAIMLRLCEPFLDEMSRIESVDPRYVFSGRLELRGLTPIHATSDQVSGWSKGGNPNEQGFHFTFTCETFFMTARVLNMGLMKFVSDIWLLTDAIITDQNILKKAACDNPLPSPLLQQEIARVEKMIELNSEELSRYEALVLQEKGLIERALSFYKAMLVWMVDLAGGFTIPAPLTCPMNFAAIPEHFVEDAMDLLMFASTYDGLDIETGSSDFMNFIIMFVGSPEFIQNPYLRAKMVKVLNCWIPSKSGNELLKGYQPALDYLVRNLLQLYVSSESTDSCPQLNDTRHTIFKVLRYLWKIPEHRDAWKRIAKEEENGVYLRFLNILMNDTIYLLDRGLSRIMKPEKSSSRTDNRIKNNMLFANNYIDMICFTTEEILAPFLVPEMVGRVASILNYFLAQLVTMIRPSVPAQNDPGKHSFLLRALLGKIVTIYGNLAKGDGENHVFATAITKDGRSYNEQLFEDAAEELNGEGKMMDEFMELGQKAKVLARQAEEAELALGEMPEEFLDPVMDTLMTDPVIIPNTNVRIDRPVILRHLLIKNTDPFSGLPLTADMLVPDTELKAKIDHFLQN